jgi:hypothetical protein
VANAPGVAWQLFGDLEQARLSLRHHIIPRQQGGWKLKILIAVAALAVLMAPAQAENVCHGDVCIDYQKASEDMVRACEAAIQRRMETSPATYRRIEASEIGRNIRNERLVVVTYDAQNIYGALVRKSETCRFDDQGKLTDSLDVEAVSKALQLRDDK